MTEDLINEYAEGNLHRVLLLNLFARVFRLEGNLGRNPSIENPRDENAALRSELTYVRKAIEKTMRERHFPDPQADQIRTRALVQTCSFFDELEARLLDHLDDELPVQ